MKKSNDVSFLGKIFIFFKSIYEKIKEKRILHNISERQKRLALADRQDCVTESKISYVFGILKIVCILLLCILLALTVVFGRGIISYENVYYMFKDIGYINTYGESRPSSLSYSKPISNQDFAAFKNGLAVVSDGEFKFFTSTGRVTMNIGSSYTNPKITCSESNALVYDQGSRSFTVYNSFVSIYSENLDYPISFSKMGMDGGFLVVTKSLKYNSVVRIYDKNFNLEYEYSKNDYVIGADISDDGKYISVTSVSASQGDSNISLNILNAKKGTIQSTVSITGIMPYFCEFVGNDRILLACSDRACIYDLNGVAINQFDYPSALSHIYVDNGAYTLAFDRETPNSPSKIYVFDKNGNITYSESTNKHIIDISVKNNNLFVLYSDEVVRRDLKFGGVSRAEVSGDITDLVLFEDGEAAACSQGVAYYISFK